MGETWKIHSGRLKKWNKNYSNSTWMCALGCFSHFQFFVTPWTVALQTPLSKGFSMLSSRGSSQPRDQTCISCIAGRFFTTEPPGKHKGWLYYVLNSVAGCLLLKEYIHCKINFFMPPLFRKHFGWLGACCESFLLLTLDVVPLRSLEAELRIQ